MPEFKLKVIAGKHLLPAKAGESPKLIGVDQVFTSDVDLSARWPEKFALVHGDQYDSMTDEELHAACEEREIDDSGCEDRAAVLKLLRAP